MKALITGGTGFVGSHLARALAQRGHQVRVLHRPSSKLGALEGVVFESALGDVLEDDALRAACMGCDWVFHVAAVADYWRADKAHMFEVNVEGTRRVLQAAYEAQVKRVVFTSSAAAVGFRDDGRPSDERIPFNLPPDQFPYGHSKWLAEGVVQEAVAKGQAVVTVNPVIVMGPGDLNLISGRFILEGRRLQWTIPITAGGVGVVDVRDVARWQIAAAEQGRVGERYLLGTANYKFRAWYAMIADTVGVARPFIALPNALLPPIIVMIDLLRRFGLQLPVDADQARLGARDIFFDYSKTWGELGEPQIEMSRSLQDTFHWYLDNGYIKDDWLYRLLRTIKKPRQD